jgi:hypothetical protein
MVAQRFFAFLQADGIDDSFALQAFQSGFQHRPLGAIDHHRNPRDVRLRSDVVQEGGHGLLGIEHGFVHIDVDDLRAPIHLLLGDGQGLFVFSVEDQLRKFRRAGHVGALADVDEVAVRTHHHGLESAQPGVAFGSGKNVLRQAVHRFGDGAYVIGGGAAAPPHDIQPAVLRKIL